MSNAPMAEGWWQASDGKYYPPQSYESSQVSTPPGVPQKKRILGKWLLIGVGGFVGLMFLIGMIGAVVAPPEEDTALNAAERPQAAPATPETSKRPPAEAAVASSLPTIGAPKPVSPPPTEAPSPPPTTAKPTTTEAARPSFTTGQLNAQRKADSYLAMSAFSHKGLIEQLEFEGFSTADATFGVDALNTDWNEQAGKKADSYLDMSAFSRSGLIGQLGFDGFSKDEATFGVDALNADWNKQAAKKAATYLEMSSFSRSGLIDQLKFEGFTPQQADYGVSTTGL